MTTETSKYNRRKSFPWDGVQAEAVLVTIELVQQADTKGIQVQTVACRATHNWETMYMSLCRERRLREQRIVHSKAGLVFGGVGWSIVDHVLRGGTEFLVPLDDFVHSIKKVLFCHRLPPCSDRVHPSLRAHTPYVSSSRVGTKTC